MARWATSVIAVLVLVAPCVSSVVPVDLVDVRGQLNPKNLGSHVKAHSEATKLKVVSAVGASPGCGKESVLNALFGTHFDETPKCLTTTTDTQSAARPKCTASVCPSDPGTLVLDSDASSSMASSSASSRDSVLALQGSMADVVLLHVWAADYAVASSSSKQQKKKRPVGAAGNRRLLQQLLAEQQHKKSNRLGLGRLVVVVHDADEEEGEASKAALSSAIIEEAQEAWASVAALDDSLPAELDGAVKVTLQFLPDPVANPAAFARGVSDLRATLKNAVNANDGGDDDQRHLLNSEDVESSVEAAWEAAKQQQQELIRKKGLGSAGAAVMMMSEAELNGMYLVDRAYEAAAVKIQAQLRAWRRTAEAGGLVADFGNKAMAFGNEVLKAFNGDTSSLLLSTSDTDNDSEGGGGGGGGGVGSCYAPQAIRRRSEKGAELLKWLSQGVEEVHGLMLDSLTKKTVAKFETSLLAMVKKMKDPSESIPDEQGNKAVREASLLFAAQAARLNPPSTLLCPKAGAATVAKVDETVGLVLAQIFNDFDESPAAKVLRMNRLQRKLERSKKQPKNPRAITPGLHLAGMLRQVGSGNLSGFAGYALGAHSVNFGYSNDRGDPSAGDTSPLLRLQPKIHFDVDL